MNQTMSIRRARTGFSLIELLVVMAVILLLLRLLLPSVEKAREVAYQVQCTNNLHQLGVGMANYLSEYNYFPGAAWPGDAGPSDYIRLGTGAGQSWEQMSCAPFSDPNPGKWSALGGFVNQSGKPCEETVFRCPVENNTCNGQPCKVSYAMNLNLELKPRLFTSAPSGTYLLVEQMPVNGSDMGQCGGGDRATDVHKYGSASLFCDGHVVWAKKGTTTQPGTLDYDYANNKGCDPGNSNFAEATINY